MLDRNRLDNNILLSIIVVYRERCVPIVMVCRCLLCVTAVYLHFLFCKGL